MALHSSTSEKKILTLIQNISKIHALFETIMQL